MERIARDVRDQRWDTVEKCMEPTPIVFVNIRVASCGTRVKVDLVQIAWLALFDTVATVRNGTTTVSNSVVPIVRMMAYGDQVRTFEVLLDDYLSGMCGPIDVVIGIVSGSCDRESVFDVWVYDSTTTSVQHHLPDSESSEFHGVARPSAFYPVVPLWNDTLVPTINATCHMHVRLRQGTPRTNNERVLCAVVDPWTKLTIAMAKSFLLPDGSLWPSSPGPPTPNGNRMKRSICLPDLEYAQRSKDEKLRCQTRCSMIFRELMEQVWNPDRLIRRGMFDLLDEL